METYVRQLCEGLQGKRFSHQVLTFHHNKKLPSIKQKVNGVTVTRIQPQVIWLSQPFSNNFRTTFLKNINQFDLVHLHFPFPQAENLVKSITQPLIITWCVDPAKTRWKILAWLARPHYRTVVKKAYMIVAIGHGIIKNSSLLNNYLKKCCTIPLSFSKKQIRSKAAYRTRFKKQFRVLFVGRLRKYKGLKYLVKAVALSSKNIVLNIVGDGEEKDSICSLISKLNLSQRVKLLGSLSENQKNIAFQNCDAFCLPSIHEAEGFGIVQAEAMSYGIPVINTWLKSGVPFVSRNGISGITVPPKNAHALAQALETLAFNKKKYNKFSAGALSRSKLFSENKMLKKYNEVYQKAIKIIQ